MNATTANSYTSATVSYTSATAMSDAAVAPLRRLTLFLCFLVVDADGFDVASGDYVAPLLKRAWNATPGQLGQIFGRMPSLQFPLPQLRSPPLLLRPPWWLWAAFTLAHEPARLG
jgi:hypothetical protein